MQGLRDIIVSFMGYQTKHKILEETRRKGYIEHQGDQILGGFFPDLSHEGLMKQKETNAISISWLQTLFIDG